MFYLAVRSDNTKDNILVHPNFNLVSLMNPIELQDRNFIVYEMFHLAVSSDNNKDTISSPPKLSIWLL